MIAPHLTLFHTHASGRKVWKVYQNTITGMAHIVRIKGGQVDHAWNSPDRTPAEWCALQGWVL